MLTLFHDPALGEASVPDATRVIGCPDPLEYRATARDLAVLWAST
jgi:hypothetical protein